MTENLFRAIEAQMQRAPDHIMVEQPDGRQYTYRQAAELTARLANRLERLGVKPGDRVAVQTGKSPETLLLYLACLRAGGVYLPLNTAYTRDELAYFVSNAEPALAICQPGGISPLEELAAAAGARTATLGTEGDGSLLEGLNTESDSHTPAPVGSGDMAAILYTSGTTGRPKGAMLTHGNLLSNASALADIWRFTASDRLLHALPIFHIHGLFVACNISLLTGARILFLEKFDVEEVLSHLPRCSVMMGVPTFYVRLLKDARFDAATTRSVRLFISGSAPLSADIHHAVRERTGHPILERYGMTETGMNTSNPYDGERRAGTVGFPLPGVDIRITDPQTGAPMERNRIGSLEVRGPNVFAGYWRMPEKTVEEFREDGYFVTGDLAFQDDDGYLHIVGRQKDLIISGGYNVYPKEVEQVVDEMPMVLESAVFGVPHPDLGEGVTAAVVPQNGCTIEAEQIIAGMEGRLARYKQPRRIIILDSLPRNVMGKVQKNALRERFSDLYTGS